MFQDNEDDIQRLDFSILQNGWTSIYHKINYLKDDIEWFIKNQYRIVEFNCSQWTNESIMHKDLKVFLDFPDYYGENYDALNDCLSDIQINNYGLLIVFYQFDKLEVKARQILLNIFADNARRQLLFGKKLISLIQVDNPETIIAPIGHTIVNWNRNEWLVKDRNGKV